MGISTSPICSIAASASFLISAFALAGCHSSVVDARPAPESCGRGLICTIAGTDITGLTGDGGPATVASLYWPADYAVGPDGSGYVVDWNNHRIRRIDRATGVVDTIAGSDDIGDGPDGPALKAHFNHPTNIVFDGHGHMLIAAWHNSKVKTVDLAAGTISDTCGTGKRAYAGDGGPGQLASFDLPTALAIRDDGVLLIMDQANQRIRALGTDGIVSTFAGAPCLVNECGPGEKPEPCPMSSKLACNPTADPYACYAGPFPGCRSGLNADGQPASQLLMSQPVSSTSDPGGRLALDRDGSVYFADTGNHRVRRIDRETMIVTTVAGSGAVKKPYLEGGYAGDGGPATSALLNRPTDIAFGPDGTLYIADTFNNCIRAVTGGIIRTVAGQCGKQGFSGDGGEATAALLDQPYGIEVAPNGDLYLADTLNSRIRLVRR